MSLADSGTLSEPSALPSEVNKTALLAGVVGTVVVLDFLTKMWAMSSLTFGYPVPVVGDFFRLTYTHNPGAAFGINIGEHSRLFFLVLSYLSVFSVNAGCDGYSGRMNLCRRTLSDSDRSRSALATAAASVSASKVITA